MPFKDPAARRRYHQQHGPEYRAAKAEEIKARQRAWFQANKDRLREKDRPRNRTRDRARYGIDAPAAMTALALMAQSVFPLDSTAGAEPPKKKRRN